MNVRDKKPGILVSKVMEGRTMHEDVVGVFEGSAVEPAEHWPIVEAGRQGKVSRELR